MFTELIIKKIVNRCCVPAVRHCANCRLFKSGMMSSPLSQQGNWNVEMWGHLLKVTWLERDRTRICPGLSDCRAFLHKLHTPLLSKFSDSRPSLPLDAGDAKRRKTHSPLKTNPWSGNITPLPQRASLGAQMVKNLPALRDTQVQSLGWKHPLEKEMATHSSILAWRISWTEEPGGLKFMVLKRVGYNWATNSFFFFSG